MQTLVTGFALTVVAVVLLVFSAWQNARARTAGQQGADESLRALQQRREGAHSDADGSEDDSAQDGSDDGEEAPEEELLQAQRSNATRAYASKRAAIIILALGLLGMLGGSLDVLL